MLFVVVCCCSRQQRIVGPIKRIVALDPQFAMSVCTLLQLSTEAHIICCNHRAWWLLLFPEVIVNHMHCCCSSHNFCFLLLAGCRNSRFSELSTVIVNLSFYVAEECWWRRLGELCGFGRGTMGSGSHSVAPHCHSNPSGCMWLSNFVGFFKFWGVRFCEVFPTSIGQLFNLLVCRVVMSVFAQVS